MIPSTAFHSVPEFESQSFLKIIFAQSTVVLSGTSQVVLVILNLLLQDTRIIKAILH